MGTVLQVQFKDGLMFPNGNIAPASYICEVFCRVPDRWTGEGHLSGEKLEKLFEKLYGEDWRRGNDDGSRYVVLDVEAQVLSAEEARKAAEQRDDATGNGGRCWFYHVTDEEEWIEVESSNF